MSATKSRPKAAPQQRRAKRAAARERGKRRKGALEILDRLLARPLTISVSGEAKRVTTLEAILLQLMQKTLAGSARAGRTLLNYQAFAATRSTKSTEVGYLETDYTQAFSNYSSREDDGGL